jgi:hypothetical protein
VIDNRESLGDEAVEAAAEQHALPSPTIWPMTLAGGVTLLMAGFATSYFVSVMGLVLLALALRGWVHDLQHEDDAGHADAVPVAHPGGQHG